MSTHTLANGQLNSDQLHNQNCFAYLVEMHAAVADDSFIVSIPQLQSLFSFPTPYDSSFPYGNTYTAVITQLETIVDDFFSGNGKYDIALFNALVEAVYHNDSGIIEQTQCVINPVFAEVTPSTDPRPIIKKNLKDSSVSLNTHTPHHSGKTTTILRKTYPEFKPQQQTNIPSLRHYSYKNGVNTNPIEYRFGTQVQVHRGAIRINPLFKRWLQIQAKKPPTDQAITHLYFNNLGFDRNLPDLPGMFERNFTLALHQLEQDKDLKLAVITLPAVKGILNTDDYLDTEVKLHASTVHHELLQMTLGNIQPIGTTDLWISPNTRKLLFPENNQEIVIKNLLTNSFTALRIDTTTYISRAQRQAIAIHFIKYELTCYILHTLKPNGFNFTCKDGIDRGAVSSAYYNLMQSFAINKPLTKEEFDTALHAAAANAKGRGINFHKEIIWNAIDAYVTAQHDTLIQDVDKCWLIFWRDMNCPHARVAQLIQQRLHQCQVQLNQLPEEKRALKQAGITLINDAREHSSLSGQRKLLEAISRTSELLTQTKPSKHSIVSYRRLADDILVDNPVLCVLRGLMKTFLGLVCTPLSFGHSWGLFSRGLATTRSGIYAEKKSDLRGEMLDLADIISPQLNC